VFRGFTLHMLCSNSRVVRYNVRYRKLGMFCFHPTALITVLLHRVLHKSLLIQAYGVTKCTVWCTRSLSLVWRSSFSRACSALVMVVIGYSVVAVPATECWRFEALPSKGPYRAATERECIKFNHPSTTLPPSVPSRPPSRAANRT
jgi:hypothetical protein